MISPTTTPGQLDSAPISVRTKLAAAWTSFMFFYIYVDHLNLYKPGVVNDILNGTVHVFEISATFFVVTIALLAVPIFMILLSVILPARANRITNLVVATLYIPFTVYNISGAGAWVSFYAFAIGLELLLLGFILRSAWTWPRIPEPTGPATTDRRAEPLGTLGSALPTAGSR